MNCLCLRPFNFTLRDVILDPFMGSGTTGVVAKKLERDFMGIDIKGRVCGDC